MKKTLKIVLYICGVLVALLLIAAVVAVMYLDSIVQKSVTVFGSQITGTKVELESVSISLLSPKVELKGFALGNPAGYSYPEAMRVQRLFVSVDRNSLFTNRIVINKIEIDGANIDFEPKITGENNLSTIKKNIEGQTPKTAETAPKETTETKPQPPAQESGKSVVIKLFVLKNAKISVSSSLIKGNSLSLPLPTVELTDIGEKKKSSMAEAFGEIFNGIFDGVSRAVAQAPDAIKLDKLQEGTKDVLDKTTKEGGKLLKDIKNLF